MQANLLLTLLTIFGNLDVQDKINNSIFTILYNSDSEDNYHVTIIKREYLEDQSILKELINIIDKYNVRFVISDGIYDKESSYEGILSNSDLLQSHGINYYVKVYDKDDISQVIKLQSVYNSDVIYNKIVLKRKGIEYLNDKIKYYNKRSKNIQRVLNKVPCRFPLSEVKKVLGPEDATEKHGLEHHWGRYKVVAYENKILTIKYANQYIMLCEREG